jgi:hypothetical protein
MKSQQLQSRLIQQLLWRYKLGNPNYGAFKKLSDTLQKERLGSISVNTLARIYGLKESRQHHIYTLDCMAQILGFSNYEHFCSVFLSKSSALSDAKSWGFNSFFFSYTHTATLHNDERYFVELSDYIGKYGCTLSSSLELGLAISSGLRINPNAERIVPFLVENPVFLDLCFETYVDIDYLNQYYGSVVQLLSEKAAAGSRTWLFANGIKLSRASIGDKSSEYFKVADSLSGVSLAHLSALISEGVIFPVARWLSAMLRYYSQTEQTELLFNCWEWFNEVYNCLTADQKMVFISMISDVHVFLPKVLLDLLHIKFDEEKDKVKFELDSLYNAGLNLSIFMRKECVFFDDVYFDLQNNHPQLYSCNNILKNKLLKAKKFVSQ